MDAYSRYNQIKVNPLDAPKISLMINNYNYYYEVILFSLNNIGATY